VAEIGKIRIFTHLTWYAMVLVLKKGASKQRMSAILKKLQSKKGVDTKKYCGTIKLKQDALLIQRQLRDEWE
jgi:hypothetical protein